MGKNIFTLTLFCFLFSLSLSAQSKLDYDSLNVLNAHYLDGDPKSCLNNSVRYPIEGARNNAQGDVIISFIINTNGKLDSLGIVETPHVDLSISSLKAIENLTGSWSPAMVNDHPISKKYYIVFRYRIYYGSIPRHRYKANKYVKRKKYKKALRQFNNAIKNNNYDSQLFSMRAAVNKELGNLSESKNDIVKSIMLQNNILAVIDVTVGSTTRTVRTVTHN